MAMHMKGQASGMILFQFKDINMNIWWAVVMTRLRRP